MRVLWFTNTPSNYVSGVNAYNGGGWISSLETAISKRKDVDLGIAFHYRSINKKVERDGVCYYPISNPYSGSLAAKIKNHCISPKKRNDYFITEYLRIINDFRPDIINIFGTEQDFGLIAQFTKIPIVIHIQGLLIPYLNAFFPPGYNFYDYLLADYNPLHAYRRWQNYKNFKHNAMREKKILQVNRHFLGRTDWDRNLLYVYNSDATYDYCGEILRDAFYQRNEHCIPKRLVITTTISSPLYKGYDVVLKCANILKQQFDLDFEWRVFGNINPRLIERKENIQTSSVNVHLMGVATQDELQKSIAESMLYVHPSYIDNSPNSVCEAQMMGCTVIGQNIGGMPSLVTNEETGYLVPANDPFQLACKILSLYMNPETNKKVGKRASEVASIRHDKELIVSNLLNIYKKYQWRND